jgi:two-component system sensor histidine kinase TtrS
VRPGSGLAGRADRIEIEQVLLNLLQNALDVMEGCDEARRQQGIVVSTQHGPEGVEVAVRDHGSGLSAEVQAHLFDPFFTTKPQGLGLGLSICRTIVESHGGHLWARNEADGGLSMCFACPRHARRATPMSPQDTAGTEAAP